MLSDEEKKAIEILKDNIKSLEGHTPFKHTNYEKVQAIETLLTAYEKEKEKNKKAIDFINDKNNYFEDGENWQNVLKIKEILEEE